jgi:4-hydroxybenzoate polyprenyltransferase
MAAGTALAIANARADLERDAAAGLESVASRLGPDRGWMVQASLLALVILVAVGSLWLRAASLPTLAGSAVASLVISGALIWGREGAPDRRQRAWEIQAVGLALLAAAWLAGLGDHR